MVGEPRPKFARYSVILEHDTGARHPSASQTETKAPHLIAEKKPARKADND